MQKALLWVIIAHSLDKLTKPNQEKPSLNISTISLKKKRCVLVVIPLYRELSVQYAEQTLFLGKSSWGLGEGCNQETTQPETPSGHNPLLLFHTGRDEAATCGLRASKRDLRALGQWLKELNVQVIFSSLPPVLGKDTETNQRSLSSSFMVGAIAKTLCFFDNQIAYMALSLQAPDGVHLSHRWEKSPSGAHWEGFKLCLKGVEGDSEPSHDKLWDGIARLEGQGVSRGLEGLGAAWAVVNMLWLSSCSRGI